MSTLQTIPGVHQEVSSEQSVVQMLPGPAGFLQTDQAWMTACPTDSARRQASALLGRQPSGSRTASG